ncbi:MAG: peptidylprolyl isomerase, partial [Pseudomonadota bacterium]
MFVLRSMIAVALAWVIALPAQAQNQFDPVATINNRAVTGYELAQRTRFLTLLNFPGDARDAALQQLINEELQAGAAASIGIELTEQGAQAGETEFAARANLTREEFLAALAQEGVAPETFRDFAGAGILWREAVQGRFRAQAAAFSEDDLERAVARSADNQSTRVLISEIVLPANTPETEAASRARAAEISRITTLEDFAAAAQAFSIATSRNEGGEVAWRFLGALPPEIAAQLQRLSVGQVTRPIELPNAIALYQLRESETIREESAPETIDYAEFLIPSAALGTTLARLDRDVDQCDDLYGFARDLPEERLLRATQPLSAIPTPTRAILDSLDENETSTQLRRGDFVVYTMLCERTRGSTETVDRAAIANQLTGARLDSFAREWLAE